MPFEQFLELTPREFSNALWERERHEEEIVTAQIKTICETIRLQTLHFVNTQLPKGKKVKNPKQLIRFQWDENILPAQTEEEMKAMMKAIARNFKGKSKNPNRDVNRKRRSR